MVSNFVEGKKENKMEDPKILEAKRLLKLIDPYKLNQKDFKFVKTTAARIEAGASISDSVIYWLRDIKDRQLEQAS